MRATSGRWFPTRGKTLIFSCRTSFLVSDFMRDKHEYHGTPGELAALMGREENKVSGRTLSRLLLQNSEELSQRGICFVARRSNGKRIIHLYAASPGADSDDSSDKSDSGAAAIKNIDPVDPIGTGSC